MKQHYDINASLKANLGFLEPEPLVPSGSDADQNTLKALGITPPPQFMKVRTE